MCVFMYYYYVNVYDTIYIIYFLLCNDNSIDRYYIYIYIYIYIIIIHRYYIQIDIDITYR